MVTRPATNATTRPAFTLIELLIVMAVLSLVMTIIVPSASRAAALARRAICAKTASGIAQAYQMRINEHTFGANKPFDISLDWGTQLEEQVNHHPLAYFCVEDTDPRQYTDRPTLERDWFGRNEGYTDLGLFSGETYWETMDFKDSPLYGEPAVWKVNPDVYASLNLQPNVNQDLPMYTPGGTPNVYYLLVEDAGGGDHDFEDLVLKVEKDNNGDLEFSCVSKGDTVHSHDLAGPDWEVESVDEGDGPFFFEMRGAVSYGMNWHANRAPMSSRTILIADYKADIIWPHLTTGPDGWTENNAPRHLGKLNVAYGDGAVEAMSPSEIDPIDEDVRETLWRPPGAPETE
jgi:prepilin-type N-terminal cleavage/methylation domain-containing protein/prepilin-type processing-associated H-X9-DG protein